MLARVDGNREQFQSCYTEQVNGTRKGSVRFQFHLNDSGQRVKTLQTEHSSLKHPALENCLHNGLKGLSFNRSKKNLRGSITFKFNVGDQNL